MLTNHVPSVAGDGGGEAGGLFAILQEFFEWVKVSYPRSLGGGVFPSTFSARALWYRDRHTHRHQSCRRRNAATRE